MDFTTFFGQYGLIILLVGLLIFMFWSSRRRMAKQKADQEQKARETVPGAEVLLQGGLYGTIVAFDPENLDQPAIIEIAPGVEVKMHSQSILRVVTPGVDVLDEHEVIEADEYDADEAHEDETDENTTVETDAADADSTTEPSADAGTTPGADAGTTPGADAGAQPGADAGTTPGADAGAQPDADAGPQTKA